VEGKMTIRLVLYTLMI